MSLFSDILNELEPILDNADLGFSSSILDLKVYSLDVLSERANLKIMDIQPNVAYLEDLATKKRESLNLLSEEDLDSENLEKRKKLLKEIEDLKLEIDQNISDYIEALCDLKEGEFDKKIDGIYENIRKKLTSNNVSLEEKERYKKFLNCPKKHLINKLFVEINKAANKQVVIEDSEGK